MKTIPSHSPYIFGSGMIDKLHADFPTVSNSVGLKIYYIISLTYHFENTIVHLITWPQNDFYQMLGHHIATIILITFSYVCGLTHIGVHVMFLMDNGDIFIGAIRIIIDWAPVFYILICWLLIMTSFIYFRLYVYWVEVLQNSFFSPKGFTKNS